MTSITALNAATPLAGSDWGSEPGTPPAGGGPDPVAPTKMQGIEGFQAAQTGLRALHDAGVVNDGNIDTLNSTTSNFGTGVAAVKAAGGAPDKAIAALDNDLSVLQALQTRFASDGEFQIDPTMDKQLSVANSDAKRAIELLRG